MNNNSQKYSCLLFWVLLFSLSGQGFAQLQRPSDGRPQEKEVMLEKIFIEAMREKILGNYESAISRYLEVVQKDDQNHVAHYQLAVLYQQLEQYDKALIRSSQALQLDKGNLLYVDFYANLLNKMGNFDKAANLYKSLTEIYPNNERIYYEWAYYLIKDDSKDQAIKVYNNLEKKIGVNPELSMRKHKLYLGMGKSKKAVKELEKLIDKFPADVDYVLFMAEYYKNMNKASDARKYYEKALSIDTKNAQANIEMAEIFRQEGDTLRYLTALSAVFDDPQQSPVAKIKVLEPLVNDLLENNRADRLEQVFSLSQKMVTVHPSNLKGQIFYGHLLMFKKEYIAALEVYTAILENDKNQLDVWTQTLAANARLYLNSSLLVQSSNFIELYPSQAIGHYYQGIAYNRKGDFVNAQKALKRALSMAVADVQLKGFIQSALGIAYSGQADYSQADQAFKEAMDLLPKQTNIQYDYCQSLLDRNAEINKVESMAANLLKADPTNIDYQATYARMLYRQNKFDKSKESFEKIMKQQSTAINPEILEHYGDVLFKLEQVEKAVEFWEKANDLGLDSAVLKRKIETKQLYE